MIELQNQEVYDEARLFLEEVKEVIKDVQVQNKKLVYASEDLFIFSLESDRGIVYEVFNRDKQSFAAKIVYIGDKKVASSYLLNLIHKQELSSDPYTQRHY